jgi:hypothetical protein
MDRFDCSPDLAKTLLELRQKAKGDYQGQSFARRILKQAFDLRQLGKAEYTKLFNWTYTWL